MQGQQGRRTVIVGVRRATLEIGLMPLAVSIVLVMVGVEVVTAVG
jgi:hypothetical protein